ncbi:hypothetical protein [Flavobacterium sp.]|uniref:hypothetical protein n=1 Tax=Flavobacterium sp. TaxID=239 RepID=UPI00286E28D6|nr:hypothetical protein [Flavobacterium sp.]
MKKIVFLFVLFCASQLANAQELGFRLGDVAGGSAAVDAVFALGKFSRVHADVSFGDGGVGTEALWDFLYKPVDGQALKWYVGVGPSMVINDDFFLGASGEIGLEYRFEEVPIVLSLDWRPTLWLVKETEFHTGGFGFNARYVF